MIIVTASVCEKNSKYYPHIFFKQMFVWITKMLRYERIDVSEGIDIDKTDTSKECMLCHYWYFKDIGCKLEPHVCNGSHDILTIAYELKNIAILNVKGVDYRSVLWGISKNGAMNMINNSVLKDRGVL